MIYIFKSLESGLHCIEVHAKIWAMEIELYVDRLFTHLRYRLPGGHYVRLQIEASDYGSQKRDISTKEECCAIYVFVNTLVIFK